jgi:hypothetical protein
MPVTAVGDLDAGDPNLTVLPSHDSAVGELTASPRVEGTPREQHRARARIDHLGLEDEHVRILVAVVA